MHLSYKNLDNQKVLSQILSLIFFLNGKSLFLVKNKKVS